MTVRISVKPEFFATLEIILSNNRNSLESMMWRRIGRYHFERCARSNGRAGVIYRDGTALPSMIGNFIVNAFVARVFRFSASARSRHQSRLSRAQTHAHTTNRETFAARDTQNIFHGNIGSARENTIFSAPFQMAIRAWRSIAARAKSARLRRTAGPSRPCAFAFGDARGSIDRSVPATARCTPITANCIARPATPARR